jgi:hypothetical protein
MGNAIPPIQRLREELHYECMHVLYCKYCATRGVCIGDAHGPGRSQGNIGMRGDCSKDTGFIQPVHDGVRRGFVDGLRRELHATYPAPDAP